MVVQIEREKVMKAPGVGEEEKVEESVGELIGEEEVEKAKVGGVRMQDCSSVAPTEASEIPEASALGDMGVHEASQSQTDGP